MVIGGSGSGRSVNRMVAYLVIPLYRGIRNYSKVNCDKYENEQLFIYGREMKMKGSRLSKKSVKD